MASNQTVKTSVTQMIAAWISEGKESATYFQIVHRPRRIPLGLLADQCPNLIPDSQQTDCAMKIRLSLIDNLH